MPKKGAGPKMTGAPSTIKVSVFRSEYSFRVEPGFVTASPGDRLKFANLTGLKVTLRFAPGLHAGKSHRLRPGGHWTFTVPPLPDGFYPYDVTVDLGVRGLTLQAIGGSPPGVIIR
jgi:hypothetical protein